MNVCPNCGSSYLRTARTRVWVAMWRRLMGRRVFSCWHCGWRGVDLQTSAPVEAPAAVASTLPPSELPRHGHPSRPRNPPNAA